MLDRTILLTYKHKTHSVAGDEKIVSNADVDFYIDDVSLFNFFFLLDNFLFGGVLIFKNVYMALFFRIFCWTYDQVPLNLDCQ